VSSQFIAPPWSTGEVPDAPDDRQRRSWSVGTAFYLLRSSVSLTIVIVPAVHTIRQAFHHLPQQFTRQRFLENIAKQFSGVVFARFGDLVQALVQAVAGCPGRSGKPPDALPVY